MVKKYLTKSRTETIALGKRFARRLRPGDVAYLTGELGSGKTTFTKGICIGLGVHEPVTSPSFVIVTEYKGRMRVSHIDLYRLNEDDFSSLPIEEYYISDGITIVEWADRLKNLAKRNYDGFHIQFSVKGKNKREISINDLRH